MGQNDSNLEFHAHGLSVGVRWHWGVFGLDVVGDLPLDELNKIKTQVRGGDPVGAAKQLAKVLSAPTMPPACYDRLGEQLLVLLG